MKFNGLHLLSVFLVCSLNEASGHLCLSFNHVKDFDVAQFSGRWYAILTTSSQSRCLVYDFKIQKKIKNVENINCFNCINCKNCVNCHYCKNSEDLVGCHYCEDSEDLVNCHYLKKSKGSVNCHHGRNAIDCSYCHYVYDCKNVHDCHYPKNCTNISGWHYPKNKHEVIPVKHQFIEALKTDPNSPSKLSVFSTQTDGPGKSPIVKALKADPSLPSKLPGSSTQTADIPEKSPIVEALKADPSLLSKLSISSTETADIPEKSPFVVFTTDYQSYAGVYFCRKTANDRKHSVAILSRSQELDKEKLDSLIEFINYNHEGVKFSIVDHTDCNHPYEAYDTNSSVHSVIGDDEKVDIHISFMSIDVKPEIP